MLVQFNQEYGNKGVGVKADLDPSLAKSLIVRGIASLPLNVEKELKPSTIKKPVQKRKK